MITKEVSKKAVFTLRKRIKKYDDYYFKKSLSLISDFEYDSLKKELNDLLAQYPDLKKEVVPTVVGDDRSEGFEKAKHLVRMYSLANTYNEEELKHFDKRIRSFTKEKEFTYSIEPKIDGLAISILYQKGKLIRAITRGDGFEGDVVTNNIITMCPSVPKKLKGNYPKLIELRGEVFMPYQEFERINLRRKHKGLELYANPRNLASGTLKHLDIVDDRKLEAVFYGIGACEPMSFRSLAELYFQIESWGLPALNPTWVVNSMDAAIEKIFYIKEIKDSFTCATDGVVIKVNEFSLHRVIGATSTVPTWAVAYKFAAEQAQTILKDIKLQIGRTGNVTPVAELEPVCLAGTIVSRATLHNEDEIVRKDIRIGDTVIVQKAGEIIPQILSIVKEKRPEHCIPFNFSNFLQQQNIKAERVPGQVYWRLTTNNQDVRQITRKIIHFASKKCMNITHLGKSVAEQLVKTGMVKNIADIYTLTKKSLLVLDKFGDKSAQNLCNFIEKSKNQDLWRLIHGLGILEVGAQTAKILGKTYLSINTLMNATKEDLLSINGVGERTADEITKFFSNKDNLSLINTLILYGLNTKSKEETSVRSVSSLSGNTYVLTGTLKTMTRQEATELIEKLGGKVSSSVSKKTTGVIVGEEAGSKFEKAKELNVPILDENFLIQYKQSLLN